MNARLELALAELYGDGGERRDWLASAEYQERHDIDGRAVHGFAGLVTVAPICLLAHGRFDLADGDGNAGVPGVVIEAFAEDGETPLDLVAWPIARPDDVRSLCGHAALVGAWQAFNVSTYAMGGVLRLHQAPLRWLQANCQGAAPIGDSRQIAGTLMEISQFGGRVAAEDVAHAGELKRHLRALLDSVEICFPSPARRAAA